MQLNGARFVRLILIALLALGALTVAPAAHANAPSTASSPERAVVRFWTLVAQGRGGQAYRSSVQQSCQKPKDEATLARLSKQIDRLPGRLTLENYSEKVNGSNARVSYNLKYHVYGAVRQIDNAHGDRWIRLDGKWFIACNQNPV